MAVTVNPEGIKSGVSLAFGFKCPFDLVDFRNHLFSPYLFFSPSSTLFTNANHPRSSTVIL